jgi:dCMP deaminase
MSFEIEDTPQTSQTPQRKSWDAYFLEIALAVSTRATCDRAHVGAVLVRDRAILATGYNGSVRGEAHCDDVGHDMVDGHCVRTVHAEVNAIAQAARAGVRVIASTLYTTHAPCWPCFKMLVNAGVEAMVYATAYRLDPRVIEAAERQFISFRCGAE